MDYLLLEEERLIPCKSAAPSPPFPRCFGCWCPRAPASLLSARTPWQTTGRGRFRPRWSRTPVPPRSSLCVARPTSRRRRQKPTSPSEWPRRTPQLSSSWCWFQGDSKTRPERRRFASSSNLFACGRWRTWTAEQEGFKKKKKRIETGGGKTHARSRILSVGPSPVARSCSYYEARLPASLLLFHSS